MTAIEPGPDSTVITAEQFACAFSRAWHEAWSLAREDILDWYVNDATWTSFMSRGLAGAPEGGFLRNVCLELQQVTGISRLRVDRERHKVDAFFRVVTGDDENYLKDTYLVMVELENNRDTVVEEMWKLIHWRVPLKVLIFYDFSYDERFKKSKCATWLMERCIPKLEEMLERRTRPDCDRDYVLVVGSREAMEDEQSEQIRWRFFRLIPNGRLAQFSISSHKAK